MAGFTAAGVTPLVIDFAGFAATGITPPETGLVGFTASGLVPPLIELAGFTAAGVSRSVTDSRPVSDSTATNQEPEEAGAPDIMSKIGQLGDLSLFEIIAPSLMIMQDESPDAVCRGMRDMKRRVRAASPGRVDTSTAKAFIEIVDAYLLQADCK